MNFKMVSHEFSNYDCNSQDQ